MMTKSEKIAVIDVGSNSVRLVVYYGAKRSPLQFFNEKVTCGLGRGLIETGILHPEGRIRALNAIRRFADITKRMGVEKIYTVATAAVRNATDGPEFCKDVKRETGINLNVVSGQEEGALSAQGIFYCRPQAAGLVCDMGGASLELAEIFNGNVTQSETSALGPLLLQNYESNSAELNQEIQHQVSDLTRTFTNHKTLYLIGGTIRSLANLDIFRKDYPLSIVNEYTLDRTQFDELIHWVLQQTPSDLETIDVISSERLAYLPLVAKVMREVIKNLEPQTIVFSSFGIREGLLYKNLPSEIHDKDPLIEACKFAEKSNARFPGFGAKLYSWIKPLFPDADYNHQRLILAACLLHDVTWEAHPDYRAEVSFGYATQSNLVGIDHQERLFLAESLIHRYKNKPKIDRLDSLNVLLPENSQQQAEVLGRAMRLGAMLGGPDVTHLGKLKIQNDQLILIIDQESSGLMGEIVERRLGTLAKSLNKEAVLLVE